MKLKLAASYELTNEHPGSAGQPALVKLPSGECFGPADLIRAYHEWPILTAAGAVDRLTIKSRKGFTEEQKALLFRFISFGRGAA